VIAVIYRQVAGQLSALTYSCIVSQNRANDDYLQGNANNNETNFGNAVIRLTKTRSGWAKTHKNHGGTGM